MSEMDWMVVWWSLRAGLVEVRWCTASSAQRCGEVERVGEGECVRVE